jgi:tripartite-type tricarboxylate transporter receptor subunit TctC
VTWFGLFATRGTPPEVIARINGKVRALFAEQAFVDRERSSSCKCQLDL